MKFRTSTITLTVALLFACGVFAQTGSSGRRVGKVPTESKYGLALRPTAGVVLGKAADYFDKFNERAFYGFGGSFEYRTSPHWILGANVEVIWKDMSAYHVDAIRMTAFSGSGMYRISNNPRKSAYLRGELGRLTGNWDSNDLGTYWFGRLGLGEYTRTGGKTATRFEIYYKKAFTDDNTVDVMGNHRLDGDAEGAGLEFAIMIDL